MSDVSPEFGRVVCTRGGASKYWVLAILLPCIAGLMAWGVVALAFPAPAKPPTRSAGILELLVLSVAPLTVGSLGVWNLRTAMTRVSFFEHGAVRRLWGKQFALAYSDAISLSYELVNGGRAYGMYSGVAVRLELKAIDGNAIVYSGDLQQRPDGPLSRITGRYTTIDELNSVKDQIASYVADRWQESILDGEERAWCKAASLSDQGITPRRGNHRRRLVEWSRIERWSCSEGRLELFLHDGTTCGIPADPNAVDFYPGLQVITRMMQASRGSRS